ncbi:MAG TPA: ABC transporter ATP-binding protein, partial [Vicinamibacteria bacterium]
MPAIEVEGVAKSFRIPGVRRDTVREHLLGLLRPRSSELLRVLDGVSFAVEPGETVAIMGRNGSGKSTLLKIVCGIYRPDRGRVLLEGGISPVLELGLGWNPELDARDNVLLVGTVMGLTLREARAIVGEVLAFAEVERFARLPLKHYSSGMAARLAYAIAFCAPRDLLVLDEIFAVGDAAFRARCEARYRELKAEGRTVLLVSHDPHVVATYCDRAVLLEGGRIVEEGRGQRVAAAYLGLLSAAPGA